MFIELILFKSISVDTHIYHQPAPCNCFRLVPSRFLSEQLAADWGDRFSLRPRHAVTHSSHKTFHPFLSFYHFPPLQFLHILLWYQLAGSVSFKSDPAGGSKVKIVSLFLFVLYQCSYASPPIRAPACPGPDENICIYLFKLWSLLVTNVSFYTIFVTFCNKNKSWNPNLPLAWLCGNSVAQELSAETESFLDCRGTTKYGR